MTAAAPLTQGANRRANVEFVSAYPARGLRAEDGFAAVTGDVLARLLTHHGWEVTREYFVNDQGPQADALARGVFARCVTPEGFAEDDIANLAAEVRSKLDPALLSASEATWLAPVRTASISAAMTRVKRELEALDVRFDVFTRESHLDLGSALPALMARFAEAGYLTDAQGAQLTATPAPPKDRVLLATDKAGDMRARALTGSEGRYTYFATDLAYHADKLRREFDLLVDVFRRDHAAYAPGLEAGLSLMSAGKVQLATCLIDPVRPAQDDDPSPRASEPQQQPLLADLLEFFGPVLLRHLFLAQRKGTPLEIALSDETRAALAQSEEAQQSALALPLSGASKPEADCLASALAALDPAALYTQAQKLAEAALAKGHISANAKQALTGYRTILGLPPQA